MRRNCPATALAHPSGGRTSCAAGCGGWGLLYFIFYILFLVTDCSLYSVSLCKTRAIISTRTLASQAKSSSRLPSIAVGSVSPGLITSDQHERQRQRCQMVRGSGADGDLNHRTRFAPRKLSFTFQRKQQLQLCASALWDAVPVAGLIPPPSRTLRLQVDHGPAPSYVLSQGLGVMQITPIVKVIGEVD